jgi:hypothetical protein
METQDKPSKRQVNVQIWKLAAYFGVVVLLTYLSRRFFLQLDLESWSAFKKVTQHSTHKRDGQRYAEAGRPHRHNLLARSDAARSHPHRMGLYDH